MPILTRSAALTGFDETARRLGLDAPALLRQAGLPVRALHEPDLLVSGLAVSRLFEDAARLCGRDDFGLLLAETRSLGNLGELALVLRDEPTLWAALQSVVRYTRLHNDSIRLHLEQAGALVLLHVFARDHGWTERRQSLDLSMAVLLRTLKLLSRGRFEPEAICFVHAAPVDLAPYRRALGPALRFGQEMNAIVCRADKLNMAIPAADPEIGRQAKRQVEERLAELGESLEGQVRQLIRLLLPTGACSVARLAAQLGVDRRTLHRRFAATGGAENIIDEVRVELVTGYLLTGGRTLYEVSELLGFSAASAFSRWFVRKFGESPSAWRRRQAGSPGASHL